MSAVLSRFVPRPDLAAVDRLILHDDKLYICKICRKHYADRRSKKARDSARRHVRHMHRGAIALHAVNC